MAGPMAVALSLFWVWSAGRATGEDGLAITIAPTQIAAPKHSIIPYYPDWLQPTGAH